MICISLWYKAVIRDFCTFGFGEANITRASNGQIDNTTEPGCRQNRRHRQSAVVAGVMRKEYFTDN